MTTTHTTADAIAAALGNDGLCWATPSGVTLDQLIDQHNGALTWRDGWHTGDTVRADFRDGSSITMAGDAWDIGYPECFCWAGVGHGDDCLQS
jgi:hypothetical protein